MSGGGFQNTYGAPNQAPYPPDNQGQMPYPPQQQSGMYPPAHGGSGFQAPDPGATPYPTGMVTNIQISNIYPRQMNSLQGVNVLCFDF